MVQRAIDYTVYLAVRIVICVVQTLPLDVCDRFSKTIAVIAHDLLRIRRQVVDENLRHAFPMLCDRQRSHLARHMWAHLLLMVCEIAHAPRKLHITNWREHSTILQTRVLVRRLLDERPVVLISGHFGNFELGGYLLGLFGFPTYTIARPLDNPFLDRFVNRFRGSTGQHIVPKSGSREIVAEILRRGDAITLLGDQSAGRKGCWVEFFGRPASTHKAVAVLSIGAEAPLLATYVRRIGGPLQYEMGLEGIVDPVAPDFALGSVPQLAQWYTECLERIIRRSPEQYWWLHRRWKGNPPESALRRIAESRRSQAA